MFSLLGRTSVIDSDFEMVNSIKDDNSDIESLVSIKSEELEVSPEISEMSENELESEPEIELEIKITPPEEIKCNSESEEEKSDNEDEYPMIRVSIPFISNKYEGKYKVQYNYPFNDSPRLYIGEIARGKRNGIGKLYYDSEYKEGIFENNELIEGFHCGNNVKYTGSFNSSNGKLSCNNGTINRQGFVFQGSVVDDLPLMDHGYIGYNPEMKINFMGYKGIIIETNVYQNENKQMIEGSMKVEFEDCFLKRASIRVCLYSSSSNTEYENKFSNVIKFGHFVLDNGKRVNDYFVKCNTQYDNNTLNIECDFRLLKHLFNHEMVTGSTKIQSDEKTLTMYEYSDNNCIFDIDIYPTDDYSYMQGWDNNRLIMWAFIAFPHFHVDFVNNLKKYNITGNEFHTMIFSLDCDFLMTKLFANSSEYLFKYIRNSYDELVIHTNVKQVYKKLTNRTKQTEGKSQDFYDFVVDKFPNETSLHSFIHNEKVTRKLFNILDVKMLYAVFNPIRIFQLKLLISKD